MKKRKKLICVIIFVLCVGAVFLAVGIIKNNENYAEKDTNEDYIWYSQGFTEKTVKNEEDAIAVTSELLNTENTDWKAVSEIPIGDTTYYRLQQYYKDIPVYGHTSVIASGSYNIANAFTSNYASLGQIDLSKTITEKEAVERVHSYEAEVLDEDFYEGEVSDEESESTPEIVIYEMDDEYSVCYQINVGTKRYFVNAQTGEIKEESTVSSDLSISEMGEDACMKEASLNGNEESHETEIYYSPSLEEYILYDEEKNIFVYRTEKREEDGENEEQQPSYIIAEDSEGNYRVWGWRVNEESVSDANAIDSFVNVEKAYDYFNEVFQFVLQQNGTAIEIDIRPDIENDELGENNAGSGWLDENIMGIDITPASEGNVSQAAYLDVMGHEFTHLVIRITSDFTQTSLETSSLNEAYADVFGEFIQYYQTGVLDWNLTTSRNLQDPHKRYNKVVKKNEPDHMDEYLNCSDVHYNSTIVSHTAYLMYNGIDGTAEYKIPVESLQELWFRSLLLLESDASFEQCCTAMELTAWQMHSEGKLTSQQAGCVAMAFYEVGISSLNEAADCEQVAEEFNLTVKDAYQDNYTDYEYIITGTDGSIVFQGTAENEAVEINLEEGEYEIIVCDQSGRDDGTVRKRVQVSHEAEQQTLEIKTDFKLHSTYKFSGMVIDTKEKPIEGVSVILTDEDGKELCNLVTDQDGKFSIRIEDEEIFKTSEREIPCYLTLIKEEYTTQQIDTALLNGEDTNVGTWTLKKSITSGKVLNSRTEDPVEDAVVSIFDENGKEIDEPTGTLSDGTFSFVLKCGTYTVKIHKENYEDISREITVLEGQDTQLSDFLIQPEETEAEKAMALYAEFLEGYAAGSKEVAFTDVNNDEIPEMLFYTAQVYSGPVEVYTVRKNQRVHMGDIYYGSMYKVDGAKKQICVSTGFGTGSLECVRYTFSQTSFEEETMCSAGGPSPEEMYYYIYGEAATEQEYNDFCEKNIYSNSQEIEFTSLSDYSEWTVNVIKQLVQ